MQARALTIRLVRLAMAASLIVPRLLFAFASWNSYRNLKALTDERLTRSLEVQQEEAQKTFQLVDLALNTTSDLVAGMSDSDIRKNPTVQLLLTDVVMPGMNGRKLAEEATQRRPSLKILYMTGYSRNAIVHRGRLDAGVDLIQKPLTSEHLATAIRKVLDT